MKIRWNVLAASSKELAMRMRRTTTVVAGSTLTESTLLAFQDAYRVGTPISLRGTEWTISACNPAQPGCGQMFHLRRESHWVN